MDTKTELAELEETKSRLIAVLGKAKRILKAKDGETLKQAAERVMDELNLATTIRYNVTS